jgi:hypothetical protein
MMFHWIWCAAGSSNIRDILGGSKTSFRAMSGRWIPMLKMCFSSSFGSRQRGKSQLDALCLRRRAASAADGLKDVGKNERVLREGGR